MRSVVICRIMGCLAIPTSTRGGVVIRFIIIVVDMDSETNCWQLNKFGASLLHPSRFQLYAQNVFIERCSRHTF